jgi:hypothetical protein
MIRIRFAVMVVGVLSTATCLGQPVPSTPLFQQFFTPPRLRLTVMSGRIVNTGGWQYGNGTSTSSDGTNKEQITFRGGGGVGNTGSIAYERTTPQEEFKIEVTSDGALRFSRTPKGSSTMTPIQFSQGSGDPLSLTVGAADKQQVYRAPTLWHLLMEHPEESRPVVALLEQLRPQWGIVKVTASVEAELLKTAGGKRPDRQAWLALVQQLGDDQFTKREAAERRLRSVGPGVLAFLQHLDFDQLDAEQQSRIRRIIKSVSRQTTDDTPEQVAAWLSEDPAIWLVLLSRADASVRQTAAKQLSAILGEPISVDPAADPAAQKDKREQLRARIEKIKPAARKAV